MSEAHGHGEPLEGDGMAIPANADTKIIDVVATVIQTFTAGGCNAVDSSFLAETGLGTFTVHFHLCVHPAQKPTVN